MLIWEEITMAVNENSKDLLSVLWAGADILRGKMDDIRTIFLESYFTSISPIRF